MQDASIVAGQTRHGVAGKDQIDQTWLRSQVTVIGNAVCRFDARVADQASQGPPKRSIGPGRRHPGKIGHGASSRCHVVGKALQADIDDGHVLLEQ